MVTVVYGVDVVKSFVRRLKISLPEQKQRIGWTWKLFITKFAPFDEAKLEIALNHPFSIPPFERECVCVVQRKQVTTYYASTRFPSSCIQINPDQKATSTNNNSTAAARIKHPNILFYPLRIFCCIVVVVQLQ